jgi:hypothetical protein
VLVLGVLGHWGLGCGVWGSAIRLASYQLKLYLKFSMTKTREAACMAAWTPPRTAAENIKALFPFWF